MKIVVGARSSPLSRAQVSEVQASLSTFSNTELVPYFTETMGDLDQKTSLRALGKTDFFTKEVDDLLLSGKCRIAVHSAKDLPEPLPQGLEIIALTRGVDPSDVLVIQEFATLETLPKNALIATSSERREKAALTLRSDFRFCDLRGTIATRLKLLEEGKVDGVVVAEAALQRLNLGHLQRIKLPFSTPLQGQLAILARVHDEEMKTLFSPLDVRKLPKVLYLGPEWPKKTLPHAHLVFSPLLETKFLPLPEQFLWEKFTHLIFTSKVSVKSLVYALREKRISHTSLYRKKCLVVGEGTEETLKEYGVKEIETAFEEQAEGLIPLIDRIPVDSFTLWPHSNRSRPVIQEALKQKKLPHQALVLYDTVRNPHFTYPSLHEIDTIFFSSPSTVEEFFAGTPRIPEKITFEAIGKVTSEVLAKYYRNGQQSN